MFRMSGKEVKTMNTQTKKVLVTARKLEGLELEEEPFGVIPGEEEAGELEETLEGAEVKTGVVVMEGIVATVKSGERPKERNQAIGPTLAKVTTQQELRDRFPEWRPMMMEPWTTQKKKLKYRSSKKLNWI